MRKNYFLSAALIALTGFGLVGCSDNPDRITNVNEVVKELVDFGGYAFVDNNNNGSVDTGEALAGVIVQVMDPVTDKTVTATTDSNGRFDFAAPLTEGNYNVKITDAAGTVSGAIVNNVEYYFPEQVINLVQAGDASDGTPEQGAISVNFSMVDEPVIVASNISNALAAGPAGSMDISGLTELTFTFNKPVTVINDPRLLDTTAGGAQMAITAEGTSAASIKGSTILSSSRTTVAYTLPTLTSKHTFSLTWLNTDYKATDSGAFGLIAAPQAPKNAGAANVTGAQVAIAAANFALNTALNGTTLALNTGDVTAIVTDTNRAKIDSVVVGGQAQIGATTSMLAGKYAYFAPRVRVTTANRGGAFGTTANYTTPTAFTIQLSNVKADLDYCPIVSYDGGTNWYYAPAAAATAWTKGNTATNGSLTINTGDLGRLSSALDRRYYLVKGYYNSSTTEGQNYTRLKVAIRRSNATVSITALGNPVVSSEVSGYTTNGIDKNTDRASDTWVNIFDGNLNDYRDRGFARTTVPVANKGNNNIAPLPSDAQYGGSSHPMPLCMTTTETKGTGLGRATWFSIVEDSSILTDLVNPVGNMRYFGVVTSPAAYGFQTTDLIISGHEEAASATLNADDNPNPTLGTTRDTVVYVYFNEPMDAKTIQSTTNWRTQTSTTAAPSVSKVEYSEIVNTQPGKEVFRAKVTLSASMATGHRLELAIGALVDKNGNYMVIEDGTKPTGYVEVYNTN